MEGQKLPFTEYGTRKAHLLSKSQKLVGANPAGSP